MTQKYLFISTKEDLSKITQNWQNHFLTSLKGREMERRCRQMRSFRKLRRYHYKEPILLYLNFQKAFKLIIDASDNAVEVIQIQKRDGVDMPVAYFTKTMNARERKYAEAEKECLRRFVCYGEFPPIPIRPRIDLGWRLRADSLDNLC